MRGLSLLLLLGVCLSVEAATVYKWVDANGVVHYSDQPSPNAQKLTIQGVQTYAARDATVTPPRSATPAAPAPSSTPAVCVIDTPQGGQVYFDTFQISGHITVANAGGDGTEIALRMDGQDISANVEQNGSFQTQVERGEHTLTLEVSKNGTNTCLAKAVTFSIRQHTASGGGSTGTTVPTVPGAPTVPMAPGVRH